MIRSAIFPSPETGEVKFPASFCFGFCALCEFMAHGLTSMSDSVFGVRPARMASLYRRAREYISPRPYIGARDFTPSSGYGGLTGGYGLKFRLMAAQETGRLGNIENYHFHRIAFDCRSLTDVSNFVSAIRELSVPPKLIILDTLSRVFGGGDENSPKDMGEFVGLVDFIRHATEATIRVVHHTGKNLSKGERGSTVLRGAADVIIQCSQKLNTVTISCQKMKDAENFPDFWLVRQIVPLKNGRSSCVLKPFSGSVSPMKRLVKSESAILDSLESFGEAGASHGELQVAVGL